MAVLLLPLAAAAFSSAIGISGTLAASALGAAASLGGGYLDSLLFPPKPQIIKNEGPRLQQSQLTTSNEGVPIKRIWGRVRLGGQVIWQTRFREQAVVTTTTQRTGKSGSRQASATTQTTTYYYYASFGVALCEGPVFGVGRIWADGKLLDPTLYTIRFYNGTMDQQPDPKIEAVEGTGKASAYRGICYIVFDEMNLEKFGNRMPQITAEVFKPLATSNGTALEGEARAVAMIAEGEFMPGTSNYISTVMGNSTAQNVINGRNEASLITSLDDLKSTLPNVGKVNMLVPWFGEDQRAQQCRVRPRVENTTKVVLPSDWTVSGLSRAAIPALAPTEAAAHVLSVSGGSRKFNATPSDRAIFEALTECQARGLEVAFTCEMKMDIAPGNALPNPYGGSSQPPYPDSSTVTCNPHRTEGGTVDGTATAATQVAWFFGDAEPSHFGTWNTTTYTIPFTGPDGWGYRRMVLHYAKLCAQAGGVESFNIGSGLVELLRIRGAPASGVDTFPAVTQMVTLLNDVKGILPGAKVSYSADWKEWAGFNPNEAANEVTFYDTFYFHLDPLWNAADYIGVEFFAPLSDWRTSGSNIDAEEGAGFTSEYDPIYLDANVEGGEWFNFRYQSSIQRSNQVRTIILDQVQNSPWIFRKKDFRSWWLNFHYNRKGRTVDSIATAWAPRTKKFRLTKVGCPAIDKGSNDPSTLLPPFSNGGRDDVIQRTYIETVLKHWTSNINNVSGPLGTMVDQNYNYVYAWDVRSYPDFPERGDLFPDAGQFDKGYWITGRAGSPSLAELVRQIMAPSGLDFDVTGLYGGATQVDGYMIEQIASLRDILLPLQTVYFFDAYESEGAIKFSLRIRRPRKKVSSSSLVSSSKDVGGFEITRNQESDLPGVVKVQYMDPGSEYQTAAVDSRRLIGNSEHTEQISYPVTLSTDYAKLLADAFLQEAWMKRETITLQLPPSMIEFDPGDVIEFEQEEDSNDTTPFYLTKLSTGYSRVIEGHTYDESVYPTTR